MAHRVTASELYQVRQLEISQKLRSIQRKLEMHSAKANSNSRENWPMVGDLGRVMELLQEVDEFLGGE